MKIALFSVAGRLSTDGSRLISALLKRGGHKVTCVFLGRPRPVEYEQKEFEALHDILKDTDLVLIAVYSGYAIRAIQITRFIRKRYPGMKVVWGGPHCISAPELGLRHADGVCFSEGDQVVNDFVEKMEKGATYWNTRNMAFNMNGKMLLNDALPPFSDLDSLPYYDYDVKDHFLLDGDCVQMTKGILKERLAGYPHHIPTLYLITSRGCPHKCSYCNNSRYFEMFGHNSIRLQGVNRVLDELENILRYIGSIEFIGFADDDFLVRSQKQIEDFGEKYKRRIGLPFGIAISANTYDKQKIEILLDSGLKTIQMGVQSGSQYVLDDVFNRKIKVSRTKVVVEEMGASQKDQDFEIFLDFIVDNPYEEKDNTIETYRYLLDLPFQVKINLFYLAFFPGTPIYERALQDGIIMPFDEKKFRFYTRGKPRYQKTYETFLILLVQELRNYPKLWRSLPMDGFLYALGSPLIRKLASCLPKSTYSYLVEFLHNHNK